VGGKRDVGEAGMQRSMSLEHLQKRMRGDGEGGQGFSGCGWGGKGRGLATKELLRGEGRREREGGRGGGEGGVGGEGGRKGWEREREGGREGGREGERGRGSGSDWCLVKRRGQRGRQRPSWGLPRVTTCPGVLPIVGPREMCERE